MRGNRPPLPQHLSSSSSSGISGASASSNQPHDGHHSGVPFPSIQEEGPSEMGSTQDDDGSDRSPSPSTPPPAQRGHIASLRAYLTPDYAARHTSPEASPIHTPARQTNSSPHSATPLQHLTRARASSSIQSSPDRLPSNALQLTTSSPPIAASASASAPNILHPVTSQHSILSKPSTTTGTPKRVSFDSNRPPGPPLRTGGHASPSPGLPPTEELPNQGASPTSVNRRFERLRARSSSPRVNHIFSSWPVHRSRSRDTYDRDPFIPVNPYRFFHAASHSDRTLHYADQVARQLYLLLFFRLPSVYFTRVGRVFEYAELSRPEVEKMIELGGSSFLRERDWDWKDSEAPASLNRFKRSWEELVDTLLREWKTLNVVSALLLSAILTIFQTDGANEPVTRTCALISLACALMSLVYGCVYILRFQTMRSMRKACRWAEAAQRTTTSITWNVWVFLALPSTFLSWSIISFITSILSFVWTTGSATPPEPISDKRAFIPRTIITVVFLIGAGYFLLIVRTFQSYSQPLKVAPLGGVVVDEPGQVDYTGGWLWSSRGVAGSPKMRGMNMSTGFGPSELERGLGVRLEELANERGQQTRSPSSEPERDTPSEDEIQNEQRREREKEKEGNGHANGRVWAERGRSRK